MTGMLLLLFAALTASPSAAIDNGLLGLVHVPALGKPEYLNPPWDYIGIILGLCWGYIDMLLVYLLEDKVETTKVMFFLHESSCRLN